MKPEICSLKSKSSTFQARPDFGGNSGGGGKKLVEVQRCSSRRDVCM